MELRQQLGDEFASRLRTIEGKSKEIWKKGELYHTYYTLHGIEHSEAVIDILDQLVAGLNPEDQLNEIEIFCLISAAYLHDVGMQLKYPDDQKKAESISESKNKPCTVQDLIRDEHHLRSGRYIKDNYKALGFDHVEAECIRLISEGHRKVNLYSTDYDRQPIGLKKVRVRLLSALLRLADELDVDYKRAPETLYEILKKDMPKSSRFQWLKHYYTSGLIIEPIVKEGKTRLLIEITCQYPREDEGRKVTEVLVLKPIEEKVDELKAIFLEHGLKLDLAHKVKLNTDLSEIPEDLYKDDFGKNLKVSIELPRTKVFVGRDDKLNELLNSLDRNIIVIEGIPGIGKTYISVKFAEKLKDRFDIYWYENLSESSTLSSVLGKLAYFLKGKNKPRLANSIENIGYDPEVLITLLKEELNSSNFAIFFDDYHIAERDLKPLLKALLFIEKSKIVVITRQEPEFYNSVDIIEKRVTKVQIDSWNYENTKIMLETRGIETNEAVSLEIHERLLGHPQYLNLFCTLALKNRAEELLHNIPKALKEAYNYLKTEVYNSLSYNEKILLQTIAIFRVPETIEAFDSVNESKDMSETLDKLINKLLVNEIGSNTFKVHDIIRDYCLRDPNKKSLRRFHEKAARYYLSLDDDPEYILEAVYHFQKAGLLEKSSEILILNARNFISRGFWDKIEIQLKNSIKSFQRKTQPNALYLAARAHYNIGILYKDKGEYDLALYHARQSQILLNRLKDKNIRLKDNIISFDIYNLFSIIYGVNNNIEKATECFEKCFQIAESQKNDYLKAIAISNRSFLLKSKNNKDLELELKYLMEALEIFESYGILDNIATTSVMIAYIYFKMNNFEKSYEYIKKALEIQKERNAFFEIAKIKVRMSKIYSKDPAKPMSYGQIIKCLEDVLETYEKMGHKRGVAEILLSMGRIYLKDKNFELAMENYRKAQELYSSWNQEKDKSVLEIEFAETLLLAGDPKEAFKIVHKIIELNIGKNSFNDNVQALALFFAATSSMLLDKVSQSYQFLRMIEKLDRKDFPVDWDFSDIEPVLIEFGENKQLFLDIIAFLKDETSFPTIRHEYIQVLEEESN